MAEENENLQGHAAKPSRWRKGLMPSRARKGSIITNRAKPAAQGSPAKARGKTRGGGEPGAMTAAARLHGYIRAAHAACPILAKKRRGRNRQGNARDTPYPALPRIGKPILADLAQQGGQERGGGGV
ncbi:hypothetical protein OCL41_08620 [Neisseria gonorrhoeae]|uniref:hypothetical protein n=1 Tax=Neisseria gonorrhoeae TaxID=485 RepID=UPI0021D7A7AF|nr:hypothetical protein [Neisseria gonorrhoeae]UXY79377.1 hypothetical protein OCL41_08620 [Neisseria gonorrhoeae]